MCRHLIIPNQFLQLCIIIFKNSEIEKKMLETSTESTTMENKLDPLILPKMLAFDVLPSLKSVYNPLEITKY